VFQVRSQNVERRFLSPPTVSEKAGKETEERRDL
jgi:hypothetical protein